MNWSFLDLRAFVILAETNSFKTAATRLGVTPSALTKRVQRLEQDIGAALFHRTTRQVRLTSAGQDFRPLARRLLDDLEEYLATMTSSAGARRSVLTVACVPTLLGSVLAPALREFSLANPGIKVRIYDGSYGEVNERVISSDADFGLNFRMNQGSELEFIDLMEDRFVVGCAKSHPLSKQQDISWQDVFSHRYIFISRHSGNRLLIDLALKDSKPRPQHYYEVDTLSAALDLIGAGLGVSVLPGLCFGGSKGRHIVTRPIRDPLVSRQIGLIQRNPGSLSASAAALKDIILDTWREAPIP